MKDRIAVGLFVALLYGVFVFIVPHEWPVGQGVESDFPATYLPQTHQIANWVSHSGIDLDYYDNHAWAYHGIPYPSLLYLVGNLFSQDQPVRGYQYFTAARVLSIVSGASVIVLCFVLFGLTTGLVSALLLAVSPLFFGYTYNIGTDMTAAVLAIWACYAAWKRKPLLAGLLLMLALGIRHEYLFIAPALGLYLWKDLHWRKVLYFAAPILILLAWDGRSWNSYCTTPQKYLMKDADYDSFPPQMFTEAQMDTIQNYYTFSNDVLKKYYPNVFAVAKIAKWRMPYVFGRDLLRSVGFIGVSCAICFLGFVMGWPDKRWRYLALALGLHLLGAGFFGVYNERYFIFEIIVVTALGWALLRSYVKLPWWAYGVVLLPLFMLQLNKTADQIDLDQRTSSRAYALKPDLQSALIRYVGDTPKLMSVRAQAAFVNGWNWQCWPKNIRNLYGYCLRYKVNLVLMSGFEFGERSEWMKKLYPPENAAPEFLPIWGNGNNFIYWVNTADSVKSLYANPADTAR